MRSVFKQLFLGAACFALAGATRAQTPADLSVYAADPAISHVSVAPDGHAVAFIEAKDGKRYLSILPAKQGGAHRIDTGTLDVRGVEWIDANHLLILHSTLLSSPPTFPQQRVTQGLTLDERTGKYEVVLGRSANVIPLMAGGQLQYARHNRKTEIFLTGLTTNLSFALFTVDPNTGYGVAISAPSWNAQDWAVAPDGFVLGAKAVDPATHQSRLTALAGPKPEAVNLGADYRPFELKGGGRGDNTFALLREGDLIEVDAETGQASHPLQPEGEAVQDTLHNRDSSRLVGAELSADDPSYLFFDDALRAAWDQARAPFRGASVSLVSFTGDYTNLVVQTSGPKSAGGYYWVDLRTHTAEPVGETYPALTADRVAEVRPFSFEAVDGKALSGFITLPPGREAKRLPAVELVHDGPRERDDSRFNATAQALASRGYAVIQVNYRGSAGSKINARGEFGRRMQTDLSDAIGFLAAQGTIDPHRVCIAGTGYGGYAALAGVTLQRDIYRCSMAINPLADIKAAARSPDSLTRGPAWDRVVTLRDLIPGGGMDNEILTFLSPLAQAPQASAPILLIQVADKDLLRSTDGGAMKRALDHANRPVQLVRLDPETQDLGDAGGRRAMLEAMIAFLSRENPS